jgi:hypothetical protein
MYQAFFKNKTVPFWTWARNLISKSTDFRYLHVQFWTQKFDFWENCQYEKEPPWSTLWTGKILWRLKKDFWEDHQLNSKSIHPRFRRDIKKIENSKRKRRQNSNRSIFHTFEILKCKENMIFLKSCKRHRELPLHGPLTWV